MEKGLKIVIGVLVLGIVGFMTWRLVGKWHQEKVQTAVETQKEKYEKTLDQMGRQVANLEQKLAQEREIPVSEEKLEEVFGKSPSPESPMSEDTTCEDIEKQIAAFFTYLDKQGYIQKYQFQGGSRTWFTKIVTDLTRHPPLITDELRDVHTLLANVTHIYRALGKDRIRKIQTIVKNESDILETTLSAFFFWFDSPACCRPEDGCPSMDVLYEYAGFFLNSLAGRSYLLRQPPKIRVLAVYYAILILDRANDDLINRHGIDIRPHIEFSYHDISNQKGLLYRDHYLLTLTDLKEKYHFIPQAAAQ